MPPVSMKSPFWANGGPIIANPELGRSRRNDCNSEFTDRLTALLLLMNALADC
jgi:hypothetical protein